MKPALDLTRFHTKRVLCDITVYTTWWHGDPQPIPCLVLVPTHSGDLPMTPAVVRLSDAWIWSEEIGAPERAGHLAVQFADGLGLGHDRKALFRILSVIRDHLGDLVFVPPEPARQQVEVANLIITREGKSFEKVVTDDA